MKKLITPILGIIIAASLCTNNAKALCNTLVSENYQLENISSLDLLENGSPSAQFASGLRCSGFSLALANMTYIKYRITQLPTKLKNNITGEEIPLIIKDINNNNLSIGSDIDISSLTLVSLFNTTTGNFPFYVTIPMGTNVSPGTYSTTMPLNIIWYYSVPALAALGLGLFYDSPAFIRVLGYVDWGSGITSSVNLTINVEPDCLINTHNISFGTAPLATKFDAIQSTLGVKCSTNTPYSVGLGDGQNYAAAGNQRAMKSTSGNNYLKYEIYKNNSTNRWGKNGTERWNSLDASSNAGVHNGTAQQTYNFTAKVLESNSNSLPPDTYKDNIIIDVTF